MRDDERGKNERKHGEAEPFRRGLDGETLLEVIPDLVFRIDREGRFLDFRANDDGKLYVPREAIVGRTLRDTMPPEVAEQALHHIARALGTGEAQAYEYRLAMPQGVLDFEARMVASGPNEVLSLVRDVTERKRAEEVLRQQSAVIENSIDGMAFLDEDGSFVYLNEAHAKLYGYDGPEELLGEGWDVLYDEEQLAHFHRHAMPTLREHGHWRGEAVGRRRDGSEFPQELSINALKGGGFVCVVRDVTERKALEAQLEHQAFHDPLTGLPNRALLMDRLDHGLARARRDGSAIAVLFLDLDRFKAINDSLGHETGDRLLVEAARRLEGCVRPGDTAARFGGDEFVVLLGRVANEGEAIRVAERVLEALGPSFGLVGHELYVTASVGIALSRTPWDRPRDLLRDADAAMYRAKERGKARYALFEEEMNARALRHLALEGDLRRAAQNPGEEFVVHYQPKAELSTGEIVCVEALVRWRHPERGLLSPEEFVPLAEELDLVVPLGRWVIGEACAQLARWQSSSPTEPPLTASANLSAKQFEHEGLVGDVARALEESGLAPGCLILEITESAVMKNAPLAASVMRKLKALGVELSIDDFGTGYSSLSYLTRFPLDYLKIDRSFVAGLGEDPNDTVVALGIIELAHAMDLKVVAEGVETEGQLNRLRGMGCDMAQGDYLSGALPADEAASLLSARPRW